MSSFDKFVERRRLEIRSKRLRMGLRITTSPTPIRTPPANPNPSTFSITSLPRMKRNAPTLVNTAFLNVVLRFSSIPKTVSLRDAWTNIIASNATPETWKIKANVHTKYFSLDMKVRSTPYLQSLTSMKPAGPPFKSGRSIKINAKNITLPNTFPANPMQREFDVVLSF